MCVCSAYVPRSTLLYNGDCDSMRVEFPLLVALIDETPSPSCAKYCCKALESPSRTIPKRRYDKVVARACLPVITVHDGGLHNKQGKKILGKYEPISCSKILRKTDTEGAVIFYERPSSLPSDDPT